MLDKNQWSLKAKLILESAVHLMFRNNFESATIQSVSEFAKLNEKQIEKLFGTDDQLRMAAMEYAAVNWCIGMKSQLSEIEDPSGKLKTLIRLFAAGSESYPDSLSLYIDLWKRLREQSRTEDTFVRKSLEGIYQYYVEMFISTLREEFRGLFVEESHVNSLAWILVVISDGLHIQSLIQSQPLNYDEITNSLYTMVKGLCKLQ